MWLKIDWDIASTSTAVFATGIETLDGVARLLSTANAHTVMGTSCERRGAPSVIRTNCFHPPFDIAASAGVWFVYRMPQSIGASPIRGAERRCLLQYQELLAGLLRLHILHHAAEGEIYGMWIIDELGRHGYRLSPGTLYPMLHTMERKGYLRSRQRRSGRSIRRLYRTTALGNKALKVAKEKLRELVAELLEGR